MAEAALHTADLNLKWTCVTAPISGRISRQLIDPGNLVKADDTALTMIVALDPMYAYFDIDERTSCRRLVRAGRLKSALDGKTPRSSWAWPTRKASRTSGRSISSTTRWTCPTGTLRLRGLFPNPDRILSPGMFVRIQVPLGDPHPSLLVSEQALGYDQGKKFLYVLNDKDEVAHRDVEVGVLNGATDRHQERPEAGRTGDRQRPATGAAEDEGRRQGDGHGGQGGPRRRGTRRPLARRRDADSGQRGGMPAAPRCDPIRTANPKPDDPSRPGVKSAAALQNRRAI